MLGYLWQAGFLWGGGINGRDRTSRICLLRMCYSLLPLQSYVGYRPLSDLVFEVFFLALTWVGASR